MKTTPANSKAHPLPSWLSELGFVVLVLAVASPSFGLFCMPGCYDAGGETILSAHCGMDCCHDGAQSSERDPAVVEGAQKLERNQGDLLSVVAVHEALSFAPTVFDTPVAGTGFPQHPPLFSLHQQLLI